MIVTADLLLIIMNITKIIPITVQTFYYAAKLLLNQYENFLNRTTRKS